MGNILITGCSSGFGLLSAAHFARKGDRVFATLRDLARGLELERIRQAEDLAIEILQLDVLDSSSVEAAVKRAEADGPIDALINNAGIEVRGSIEDISEQEARLQFDTNVHGALRMIRAVLPGMRQRGSGTIVNISSIGGLVGRPFGGLYAATKHALEAISEALYFEVQPFGVRVAVVEPGQFDTPLHANLIIAERSTDASPYRELGERFEQALGKLVPGGKRADPQAVVEVIYSAVYAEPPRFRYLVGQDAELIARVHREQSFEEYEQTLRTALDWHD